MNDKSTVEALGPIAPVHRDEQRPQRDGWAGRLVLFLRVMAGLSLAKGLYHWAAICGFGAGPGGGFAAQSLSWQTATVFFAVVDLVAAVGLWLGASWGTTIWLASWIAMIVVYALLPQIYGFRPILIAAQVAMIAGYVYLAYEAARERQA